MKKRLEALEARMAQSVDAIVEPREEVDAAEVLHVLHMADAFPPHIERAIVADAENAGQLLAEWLEVTVS